MCTTEVQFGFVTRLSVLGMFLARTVPLRKLCFHSPDFVRKSCGCQTSTRGRRIGKDNALATHAHVHSGAISQYQCYCFYTTLSPRRNDGCWVDALASEQESKHEMLRVAWSVVPSALLDLLLILGRPRIDGIRSGWSRTLAACILVQFVDQAGGFLWARRLFGTPSLMTWREMVRGSGSVSAPRLQHRVPGVSQRTDCGQVARRPCPNDESNWCIHGDKSIASCCCICASFPSNGLWDGTPPSLRLVFCVRSSCKVANPVFIW